MSSHESLHALGKIRHGKRSRHSRDDKHQNLNQSWRREDQAGWQSQSALVLEDAHCQVTPRGRHYATRRFTTGDQCPRFGFQAREPTARLQLGLPRQEASPPRVYRILRQRCRGPNQLQSGAVTALLQLFISLTKSIYILPKLKKNLFRTISTTSAVYWVLLK